MESSRILQQLLRSPVAPRNSIAIPHRTPPIPKPSQCLRRPCLTPKTFAHHASTEHLPRIAQPSFWQSLIPRALRNRRPSTTSPTTTLTRKPWNPATIFIILPLLVGSGAIQLLVLRTEMTNFSRKADAHIALLREVVERVKRGEEVDVEGVLGAGVPEREADWEEVMREIEREDTLWKKKGRGRRRAKEEEGITEKEMESEVGAAKEVEAKTAREGAAEGTGEKRGPVGFY
ncbi:hypothetical protein W97_02440 [Coniosporium apollinis CBS 100218]|uniref:Uncharacterized protein n=1 Tax=Coniosporium apollinis (strain CBS 100218) TaxID=1168221 RepID=R7YMX6_CONA1|nr:uncharacterized protein W97_02440 [Coniosporium apollinis CBS 100218]EON63213.1 hypothetical protein W97_02440 [Coniosporium apollinis CBS 100218]